MKINQVQELISIPDFVYSKMEYLGMPQPSELDHAIKQFMHDSDITNISDIDWYYFCQWVSMCTSDH